MPDPRSTKEGVCRVAFIGPTGIEWICVRKVHAKIYKSRRGKPRISDSPDTYRHYFVNRWPRR